MKYWRFGLAVVIAIAMLALAAVNVVRVDRSTGTDQIPTDVAVASSPDEPLTLESAYLTAQRLAQRQLASPSLMFAGLQADWPLDEQIAGPPQFPPGGWARFAFVGTGASGGELLSVVVERYSGEVMRAERQTWDATSRPSLPVGTTLINSQAALLIAEQGYGQAFRLQCPVDRHESDITLVASGATLADPAASTAVARPADAASPATSPIAGGTPVPTDGSAGTPTAASTPVASAAHWLVSYRDGRQPGENSVEMEIDAATGQVLVVRDRSLPCDSQP